MPPQKEKQKATAPTPGLLRRIFGGPISESTQEEWPELASAWAQQEFAMPSETTWTNRVRPFNFIEKWLNPQADAIQWPWGTIAINKPLVERDKQDLGDVLTHELTHVGQTKRGGWGDFISRMREKDIPYYRRPSEMAAFEAEKKRKKPTDIHLPPPGKTGPTSEKLRKLIEGGR